MFLIIPTNPSPRQVVVGHRPLRSLADRGTSTASPPEAAAAKKLKEMLAKEKPVPRMGQITSHCSGIAWKLGLVFFWGKSFNVMILVFCFFEFLQTGSCDWKRVRAAMGVKLIWQVLPGLVVQEFQNCGAIEIWRLNHFWKQQGSRVEQILFADLAKVVFLHGHDHVMQHFLENDKPLYHFGNGVGGMGLHPFKQCSNCSEFKWGESAYGFAVHEVGNLSMKVHFVDVTQQVRHSVEIPFNAWRDTFDTIANLPDSAATKPLWLEWFGWENASFPPRNCVAIGRFQCVEDGTFAAQPEGKQHQVTRNQGIQTLEFVFWSLPTGHGDCLFLWALQELQLVEDVVLVYGGWAEGPEHVDFAALEPFKQRQVLSSDDIQSNC